MSDEQPKGDKEKEIFVDSDWKERAEREKEELSKKMGEKRQRPGLPPADFMNFLSGFAAQIMFQMGILKNPLTNKVEVDLEAAKYSIDILSVLKEKTKGNLTPDETRYLDGMLYEFRMRYVETVSQTQKNAGDAQK